MNRQRKVKGFRQRRKRDRKKGQDIEKGSERITQKERERKSKKVKLGEIENGKKRRTERDREKRRERMTESKRKIDRCTKMLINKRSNETIFCPLVCLQLENFPPFAWIFLLIRTDLCANYEFPLKICNVLLYLKSVAIYQQL